MNQLPIINMIGGFSKNKLLSKTLGKLKDNGKHLHTAADHTQEALNSINAHIEATSNLTEHTEQILNQKNYGFFSKIYSSIVELGSEFWLGIIAGVVIRIIAWILYENYNNDVDISNVTEVVEDNDKDYNTNIRKQRKLLYYIKDKFIWAEFTSSVAIILFSVRFNSWLVRKLAEKGYSNLYDYMLISIVVGIGWYSGFLDLLFSFIDDWIKDDK